MIQEKGIMKTISEYQLAELVELLKNPTHQIIEKTRSVLDRYDLVDNFGNITSIGKELAIQELSLKEQCERLGIEKREYSIIRICDDPEINLKNYLDPNSDYCCWAEGRDILLGIHACSLNILKKINKLGIDDARKRYIEAQYTLYKDNHDDILNEIYKCTRDEYLKNYDEVYHGILKVQDFVKIENDQFIYVYDSIISKYKIQLAELLFEDPYAFRKGWPDLTRIYQNTVELIEVKKPDRLIQSQIHTIPRIIKIGINCYVGHVKYKK
jgi:hypothetical protein